MRCFPHSSRQTRSTPQNRPPRFRGLGPSGHRCRTAGVWVLIVCCARLGPAAAAEPAALAAENFLRNMKGVSNIPGGKVWLCGAERTLRSCLASLGDSRRDLVQEQRFLDQRIQQNSQRWEANRQQIAALKATLSETGSAAPERKPIEQQIRTLESQAVDPDQLAAQGDVRTHLIQFTNARNALAVRLLTIRRAIPQMESEYRSLEADLAVRAALRTLGEGQRLGPLENYLVQLRRLDEYERLVFTPWLPIYLQSGRIRAGGILNETTPFTFSWDAEGGPTILSESMLEAAGLPLPAGAAEVSLPLGSGRTLTARRMIVPALRLGQVVLRDVPVHVSGPDGEDVGAVIGADLLAGYDVNVERARLQLSIRPR